MLFFQRQRGATWLARLMVLVVLAGGLGTTWIMARISAARHAAEVDRVFSAEYEAMRNAVSRQLDLFFDVLASIGQLHELSDQISESDFAEFTSKGMQFQKRILSVYGFVQRIPHAYREALENKRRGSLRFVEPEGGRFVTAGVRPEYFPLVYQQPDDALAFPLGADMAALPGVADSIVHMDQHAAPVIARSLRMQDNEGRAGFLVFSPLYQGGSGGERLLSGFTVAILWPQDILERALAGVATRDVLIRFFDPELHPEAADAAPAAGPVRNEPLPVADRQWQFEASASPEYLAARRTVLPDVILATGGAITVLLTAMMWMLAHRTRRIERAVQERTRELKTANHLLSESMHERMRLEREILETSEREKKQLGHDLHDSLGQKLTGAVFLSKVLGGQLEHAGEETRAQAARITATLKDAVAQVRRMARGLSPVELGEDGLPGALRRLAEETSSVYGITCLFHAHNEPGGDAVARAAHHLYAIALEAVTNAMKHGQAREIVIELARNGGNGMLTIEDNGAGFDPGTTQRGGMGLRIMHYRATMIGGHTQIERRSSGGMKVICVFPVT